MYEEVMTTIRKQAALLQSVLKPDGLGTVTSKLTVPKKLFQAWVAGMVTIDRQDVRFWYAMLILHLIIFVLNKFS
jgi:hypothetical protein